VGLTIRKPGQGYWTRLLTAVGAGVLVLVVVAWLTDEIGAAMAGSPNLIYIQAITAVVVILVSAGILFWVMNWPRVVDFLIATEAEMKKVNWPSRRQVVISTWIVICGTFLMALILLGADVMFSWLAQKTHILESAG